MSDDVTVDGLIRDLGDCFVGLWRFQVYGQRRQFGVTYIHKGCYFDTEICDTAEDALLDAVDSLERMRVADKNI